jgi:UDP-N-acetylmuramate: L-alanyl-gamma-D-glutamyl-meso-diaminopimelate ligase
LPHVSSLPAKTRHIHIMGIAGTAMAAFAGMLKDAGYHVTGSDQAVYPPMSTYLAELGIPVMEGFKAENLTPAPDLVIVGNVIRAVYAEAEALMASDIAYCSFPEALRLLFLGTAHPVVVAGTHGKTTTTALTAWLFESAGLKPGFLIGGRARNFDRTARAGDGRFFVIEGDEYDTAFFDKGPKFLHYAPKTAILTSVEFDHADIYRDLDHVKSSFRRFIDLIPKEGALVARWDDENVRDVAREARCDVLRYGPAQPWDGRIESVDTSTGLMKFTVLRDGRAVGTFDSALVGEHNLYNQVAATAVALRHGITPAQLVAGYASFEGVKRRQEIIGEPGGVTVIDDFAHHPTAVKVTIDALRRRFGSRRLWVIWEPRSATSRRNVFQGDYATAFDRADHVVIPPPTGVDGIDPAERFSSQKLVADLAERGVDATLLANADEIAATVAMRAHPYDVVAVFSNGGFDGLHGKLLKRLASRFVTP